MKRMRFKVKRKIDIKRKRAMDMNHRIFKTVLVLMGVVGIVSGSLVVYFRLDEPVFFDHYYDQRVYAGTEQYQQIFFDLSYITNVDDNRVVSGITFPEHPEVVIRASEYGYGTVFNWESEKRRIPGRAYGRYSVRNVTCEMIELPQSEEMNEIVVTRARVLFDDASEMMVDIGEIHLYGFVLKKTPLKHIASSGSSDGTGETNYKLLENLTLTAVDSALMPKVKDSVKWQINNSNPEDLVGMTFEEGDFLDVTTKISFTKGDLISQYTLFDINPELTFVDEAGTKYVERLYNIDSIYHSYSFMTLYRYIKMRGVN